MKYKLCSISFVLILFLFSTSTYAQQTTDIQNQNNQQAAQQPNQEQEAPLKDEDIDKAVKILMGLGMVQGKEDGKFHPEQNITREEFVKIIIEFLGMSDEINLVNKQVNFKDVEPTRWSAGYVSLAIDRGLIKGYEDNTFRPDDNITFEQGVTIVLRALGYKDEYLEGQWPLNYILKATSEGILKGVDSKTNSLLTRGNSALMIYNAFDAKYITGFEGNHHLSEKSFLEGRLNIYRLDNMRFIEKDNTGSKNSIKFEFLKDNTYRGEEYKEKDQKQFYIKDNSKFDLYEGMDCTLFIDTNGYVICEYNDLKNKEEYKIQTIINSYSERPEGKIKLSSDDSYIVVDGTSNIYLNGEKIDKNKYDECLNEGAIGTFIIKDNKLTYANIIICEYKNFLVKEVDAIEQTVKGISTEDSLEGEIDFKDFEDNYKIYLIEGDSIKSIKYYDITKDYMLSISEETDDNKERIIYTWKNNTAGKFQKVIGGVNNKEIYFTITEKPKERFYIADTLAYRYNENKDINIAKDKTYECKASLEEFYNQRVNLYKDLKGEVVYIEGNFNSNNGLYGVLIKFGDELRGEIQILNKSGSKKVYAFEDPDEYLRLKEYAQPGCIIKYSINKSNKIKNLDNNLINNIFDQNKLSTIKSGDDFGEDYAVIDGKKYTVNSDTVYFDYTNKNPYNVKKVNWDRFKDKKVISDIKVVYLTDGEKLEFLAIRENMEGIQEETSCGYVYNSYNLGDKEYVTIGNDLGELKEYQLDDSSKTMFLDQRIILYKINTNNKLEVVSDKEYSLLVGKVDKKSDKVIDINDESYIFHKEDKLYTNSDEKLTFSKLRKGDIVIFYVKDSQVMIGKLLDYGKYSRTGEGTIENIDVDNEEISIDVKGETKTFYCTGETDYIMPDGYLKLDKKDDFLIEQFYDEISDSGLAVKFIYNKETEEIYRIIVQE